MQKRRLLLLGIAISVAPLGCGSRGGAGQPAGAAGSNGRQPMISQRVVNDTAQTLAEIEQRYPPLAALRR